MGEIVTPGVSMFNGSVIDDLMAAVERVEAEELFRVDLSGFTNEMVLSDFAQGSFETALAGVA